MCKHCIGDTLHHAATIAATEMVVYRELGDTQTAEEYATLTAGFSCLQTMLATEPARFIQAMKELMVVNRDLLGTEEVIPVDPNDCYWADVAAAIAGA